MSRATLPALTVGDLVTELDEHARVVARRTIARVLTRAYRTDDGREWRKGTGIECGRSWGSKIRPTQPGDDTAAQIRGLEEDLAASMGMARRRRADEAAHEAQAIRFREGAALCDTWALRAGAEASEHEAAAAALRAEIAALRGTT